MTHEEIKTKEKEILDILSQKDDMDSRAIVKSKEYINLLEKREAITLRIKQINLDINLELEKFGLDSGDLSNYKNAIRAAEKYLKLSENTNLTLVERNELEDEYLKSAIIIDKYQRQTNNRIDEILTKQIELRKESEKIVGLSKDLADLEKRILKYKRDHLTVLQKTKLVVNAVKETYNDVVGFAKDLVDEAGKVDQASANLSKTVGGTAVSMKRMRDMSLDLAVKGHFGVRYNVSAKELIKLQEKYVTGIGRAINLTNTQKDSMAAMSAVIGEDATADISSKLENFGYSLDAVGSTVSNMFNTSTKKGLVFQRVTKNFVDNIKLAQNYTFKEGLKGLEKMAYQATKLRLDMQQTAAFANKVSNVEGAIETGANLQVLGGSFTQFSNPMGMLYESLNDMGGLQDRMVNMFSNLGSWNEEKGQVDTSAFNRMRIKGASEAMGVDYDAMMESIMAKGKNTAIMKAISGNGLFGGNDELKELVANTATWNTKEKSWGVSDSNGQFKNIKDITELDRSMLLSNSNSQAKNISDIAMMMRGMEDVSQGVTKSYNDIKAKAMMPLVDVTKNIMKGVGESNNLLRLILLGVTIGGVGGVIGGGAGRFKSVKRSFNKSKEAGPNPFKNNIPNRGGRGKNNRKNRWNNQQRNTPPPQQAVNSGFKGKLSNAGKFAVGKGSGAAALTMIGANVAQSAFTDEGSAANQTLGALGSTAGGALLGAQIGSLIGPVGTAVGAIVGGLIGLGASLYSHAEDNEKLRKEEFATKHNLNIQLEKYSEKELELIKQARDIGNTKILTTNLLAEMRANGDISVIGERKSLFGEQQMANGGLLSGKSHANGGIGVKGSNISLEGGEFVINKESTRKHFPLLTKINSSKDVQVKEPIGKTFNVSGTQNSRGGNDVSIKPINLNVSGTIKLDAGNSSSNIDANQLLKEPVFLRQITDLIMAQMNRYEYGGLNKDKMLQKF